MKPLTDPTAAFFGLNPGFISTNIRSNLLGAHTLRYRFIEWLTRLMTPSAETYAARLAPLLVSQDLEGHTGAMFNRKGLAVLPSPKLTGRYVKEFIAASEALVSRVNIRLSS